MLPSGGAEREGKEGGRQVDRHMHVHRCGQPVGALTAPAMEVRGIIEACGASGSGTANRQGREVLRSCRRHGISEHHTRRLVGRFLSERHARQATVKIDDGGWGGTSCQLTMDWVDVAGRVHRDVKVIWGRGATGRG